MKFSNRKKDFLNEKSSYILKYNSYLFDEVNTIFKNIAHTIGISKIKAMKDAADFAKGKTNKNSLIPIMLFGSPVEANKYVQGISKKTKHKLEKMIKDFSIVSVKK